MGDWDYKSTRFEFSRCKSYVAIISRMTPSTMAISPPIRIWCGGRCAIRRNVSRQELGKMNGNIPSIISINAIASSNDAAISIRLKAPQLSPRRMDNSALAREGRGGGIGAARGSTIRAAHETEEIAARIDDHHVAGIEGLFIRFEALIELVELRIDAVCIGSNGRSLAIALTLDGLRFLVGVGKNGFLLALRARFQRIGVGRPLRALLGRRLLARRDHAFVDRIGHRRRKIDARQLQVDEFHAERRCRLFDRLLRFGRNGLLLTEHIRQRTLSE